MPLKYLHSYIVDKFCQFHAVVSWRNKPMWEKTHFKVYNKAQLNTTPWSGKRTRSLVPLKDKQSGPIKSDWEYFKARTTSHYWTMVCVSDGLEHAHAAQLTQEEAPVLAAPLIWAVGTGTCSPTRPLLSEKMCAYMYVHTCPSHKIIPSPPILLRARQPTGKVEECCSKGWEGPEIWIFKNRI